MSDGVIDTKRGGVSVWHILTILVLCAAVLTMGALTVKKYAVKEPTVNPQEAQLKALTEMVTKNPNDLDSRLKLAYAYQTLEQYDLAKEQYAEALKIFPNELAANYNLGVIAREEKDLPKAEKYLTKVLSLKKEHVLAAMTLSEIYLEQGKTDKVIEVTDDALKRLPGKTNLMVLKARALEKQGKTAEAKKVYTEVLKYVPDDKDATDGLARLK